MQFDGQVRMHAVKNKKILYLRAKMDSWFPKQESKQLTGDVILIIRFLL